VAKRVTKKKVNSTEMDGKEFFEAIHQIEQEKGIKPGYMMEKVTQALLSAYRRDHEGVGENLVVEADEAACTVRLFLKKEIVEEVDNPAMEISLEEARASLPQAELGDTVRMEVKARNFGRIAAQTARQVIIQGIREAEQGMIYDEFCAKEHELLTGVITRIDPRSGSVSLRLHSGAEFTDAYLGAGEQVKGERYMEGQRLKIYVVEVRRATKGPQVLISRTHPGLVKRLFELEVPEIYDGTVEIKSVAREAGSRTKLAVMSHDPNVDAVGACIGARGARVNEIVEELGGAALPAIGFAAGIERLLLLMENTGASFPAAQKPLIYVAGMDDITRAKAFEIVAELRLNGINAEADLMERSVKAQFKYADKLGAQYVAVIGGNELISGEANIKNMTEGTQTAVKFGEIYSYLKCRQSF